MHRVGRRIGRLLGVLALLATATIAATAVAAPPAFADGSSNCSTAWILCTTIQYSGSYQAAPRDPNGDGGGGSGGSGYISSCWLQPQTAWGDSDTDASSPAGLEQFFNDLATEVEHEPDNQAFYEQMYNLYNTGKNDAGPVDPGVGLTAPPFNEGVTGGRWYGIACDLETYKYTDYLAIQHAMGVSPAQLNYEAWFWIANGQTLPATVQVVTPNMLAGYAANHVLLTPQFPALSPPVGEKQTVNLPVESVNGAGQNGYQEYQTSATLAGITSTVQAYPVSVTYSATPQGLITPASVTCTFDENGEIASPCSTFQFTEPAGSTLGYSITATTTWNVTWSGSADYGEAGWTEPLPGPPAAFTNAVTVQEIQTINN
jgi:hypothetical protein